MTAAQWKEVKRLFRGALERPIEEREAWLAGACEDAAVRAELAALLASLSQAGDFLEHPCGVRVSPGDGGELADQLDADRFAPGSRLGRYEILGLLGAGGMGEVYRAHDTRLDRIVVLKVLAEYTAAHPEWRARLEQEARAISSLNHPHVCALYDIGQEGDVDFLVMEYLEGETLAERLRRGPLPIADVLTYGSQIAGALESAHAREIVHRDLKPANIMLTAAGAKLLDFSVAKPTPDTKRVRKPSASGLPLTRPGTLVGTPEYMAPEQVKGATVDGRTDIFAFGVVLYETATGRKAFAGDDQNRVFEAILAQDPPPMRQPQRRLHRAFDRLIKLDGLIKRCLAKDPADRWQSMGDVRRELASIAWRRGLARRVRWTAAAAVLLAFASFPFLTGRQRPSTSQAQHGRIMMAVLPFADQSGDPASDYFTAGLTEELISELARLQPDRLGVIGRNSAMRYRDRHMDAAQIGRELGVDYFVEGSATRAGQEVRITVQLARTRDQTRVWAERYERKLDHILFVQADVARSIAREIALTLTPGQEARLAARHAVDPETYELYLKGRFFWNKRTADGLRKAVEYFEQAARKDPTYAPAYAGIADSYVLLGYYAYLAPQEAYTRARAAATNALQIDDGLAEAHVSLGAVHEYDGRWVEAEAAYRRALELNPNYPTAHQWYANHLIAQARRDEAQGEILRARQLDPLSLIIQVNVANVFLLGRDYDRTIQECQKALDMDATFVTAHWVLGRAYELRGQFGRAIEEFQRGLALERDSTLLRASLAHAYAASGSRARAMALLEELEKTGERRYVSALDLAAVHAALGHADRAFGWLERAVTDHASLLNYINVDPAYDGLRTDRRFAGVLRQAGFN